MAVIQNPKDLDNPVNYVATLAFFCCITCVVLVLKFRGFRASMNLSSWRKKGADIQTSESLTGAYRINRDELYGNGRLSEPPKKLTPSMVVLPPSSRQDSHLRPTKSTSDLTRQNNQQEQLSQSVHDVSSDPRGRPPTNTNEGNIASANTAPARPKRKEKNKNEDKEQKKLEKQRLAEQKAKEKAEAQERARKEKIRKGAEKKAAQEQAKATKAQKKKAPAIPTQAPSRQAPPAPRVISNNPLAANPTLSYSTNTLESSISKTSGPPPYTEIAKPEDTDTVAGNPNSNSGNISFGKPINKETNSWDLISQHRQQIRRPVSAGMQKGARKNMVLDLQYKLGNDDKDNTDA